jgi:hypothetical protein
VECGIQTLLLISAPPSGIRFRDTKGKIIPGKRVRNINPSLSHRCNLESVLETKEIIILEKNAEHKPLHCLIAAIWDSFRDKGKNYSEKNAGINSSPYLIAAIWNPV